jgi:N-methylhydantoinase A
MYTIDLDVGGTFTDGFFSDGNAYRTAKVPTTPHDVSVCVLDCVNAGADAFDIDLKGLLAQASVFRLSTTIGTNLIVQGRGAKVGLIVSKGAEENLYGDGPAMAINKGYVKPDMVKGISGRIESAGETEPLDAEEILAVVRELIHRGARIIGVSLRDAWRNDRHETDVRRIVHERYPVHYLRSVPLQLGSEISPATDDLGRTNSLIVNALLHRDMTRSLYDLEDRLRDAGYRWPLLVTHASGGSARVAKTVAAETLHSGPAAAVLGAWQVAKLIDAPSVIAADMGGTSLDVAFSSAEQPPWNPRPSLDDIQLAIPMLGVESIGAGGGSIARVDANGAVTVGPDSAGAAPGPACYAKGGLDPTVTDADLVLGFIGPSQALAGRLALDIQLATQAIQERVAGPADESVDVASLRIRDTVDREMATAIQRGIHDRGLDPADVTLLAFGGAGPLHAAAMAALVGVKRLVAFPFGSVFSAYGSSTTNVAHLYRRTHGIPTNDKDLERSVDSAAQAMRETAIVDMRGEGFTADQLEFHGMLELRSSGQAELVPFTTPQEVAPEVKRTSAMFDAKAGSVELEASWLISTAAVAHWVPGVAEQAPTHRPPADAQRQIIWSGEQGPVATDTYQLESLKPGAIVQGPAVVDAADTGYVVPTGWMLTVDRHGFLVMEASSDD